jgi:hypothetical protein
MGGTTALAKTVKRRKYFFGFLAGYEGVIYGI